MQDHCSWAPWLAIAGVLNSALSLAYYGWIIRKMYFEGENSKKCKEPKSIIAIMDFLNYIYSRIWCLPRSNNSIYAIQQFLTLSLDFRLKDSKFNQVF